MKKKIDTNLIELVEEFFKEFEIVYLVDVNGILYYKPQLSLIKKLASIGKIWIDNGARYSDDIIDPLISDVSKIVVGTKTLSNLDELNKAIELSEEVIFGIDYDNGIINHWDIEINQNQLLDKITKMEIDTIIFYDWGIKEENKEINKSLIENLINNKFKTYIGGGIKEQDFEFLESFGIDGAIVNFREVV